MTIPSVIIGILISSLFGTVFHLWLGGGAGNMLLYLFLSWFGFWIGHGVASLLGWHFLSFGPLNLGLATLMSVIFLMVGHWLSLVEVEID